LVWLVPGDSTNTAFFRDSSGVDNEDLAENQIDFGAVGCRASIGTLLACRTPRSLQYRSILLPINQIVRKQQLHANILPVFDKHVILLEFKELLLTKLRRMAATFIAIVGPYEIALKIRGV